MYIQTHEFSHKVFQLQHTKFKLNYSRNADRLLDIMLFQNGARLSILLNV